jgi:3-hydroxyanthranilate 3,4-dioxygenase
MGKLDSPIDLENWIDENRDDLQPPIGNKKIYEDNRFMVFAVGGPNARKDYHIDPEDEFFYQVEGSMTLKVVEDGEKRDIEIGEGEIFLLPAGVPHLPQREEGTIGIVVEHVRPEDAEDGLRWYCDNCDEVVYEDYFHLTDIVAQLKEAVQAFWNDDEARTCSNCGEYLEKA